MIRLPSLDLPAPADSQLQSYQHSVDQVAGYDLQVAAAKREFARRNVKRNQAFTAVKTILTEMCSGEKRCCYCEDSVSDEVEHIFPKDLYPAKVFAWKNYVYACGACNGPKNNHFAVIAGNGTLVDVSRPKDAPHPWLPPDPGAPALIDPRQEDPMAFLELDLLGTFFFVPRLGLNAIDKSRAKYSLEILHLNDRDTLVKARRVAYYSYRSLLGEYIKYRDQGSPASEQANLEMAIRRSCHATVWHEMIRQRQRIPELTALFARAPEALAWQ